MILIVGLGNPGKQYSNTRHNVGFMAADLVSDRLSFAFSPNSKFNSEIAIGDAFDNKVIIAKPITYMNLSGDAVGSIAHYYKIPLEKIIVIHDDIDLKLGEIRVKRGGGHGGHNGLRSIDGHIGKDYWRIRVGVGRPENKDDVADYVLTNFSKDERVVIDETLHDAIAKVQVLAEGKFDNNQII
jgi:PTH1 family peptidyl-tRNA hydrolase